ncbi:MAG: biotin-dependent carboxyltransferase family protein [Pseudooceanicola sp.]|nr:biotin-dependent carboxyltransferase family protein [Pseudooceanicola sp.]
MGSLTILRAGPALSVQDLGRPGHLSEGLSPGGAMDRLALLEAAALLDLPDVVPAIEMASTGGRFSVDAPMRIALTGAPMKAAVDGAPAPWAATVLLLPGQVLEIGGATAGTYGYLTPAGGIRSPDWLGSRSAHLVIGVGGLLASGDTLTTGDDPAPQAPARRIDAGSRFNGGTLRLMPGPQTGLFDAATLERIQATGFTRSAQANRQGIRLDHDGAPFPAAAAKGLASDFILTGDVQLIGEGIPFVLMAECQTIGGYPRLGTVIPDDLPRIAQAPAGAPLRLALMTLDQADALWTTDAARLRSLKKRVQPLIRDPRDIPDLLGYQLIGGMTRGDDLDRKERP